MLPNYLILELTSFCNGSCFDCARKPTTKLKNLDISVLKKTLTKEFVENLQVFELMGRVGDFIFYPHVFELLDHFEKYRSLTCNVILNTNGSFRDVSWWKDLGPRVARLTDKVVFALDGLEDTHKLHRKSDFNTVIKNLSAFTNAGGRAVWQFIVFEHNQHQVTEAKKLAMDLGCVDFQLMTSRVYNETMRKPTNLEELQSMSYVWAAKSAEEKKAFKSDFDKCMFVLGAIHISCSGLVAPCCFLGPLDEKLKGIEKDLDPDLVSIFDKNRHLLNINTKPLSEILESEYFKWVKANFNRLNCCRQYCGIGE